MKKQKISISLPLEIGGEEIGTAKILCDYYPEVKGRYSGPPEDCYPGEPAEIDVLSVSVDGVYIPSLVDLIYKNEKLLDEILINADEDYHAEIESIMADKAEEQAEARRLHYEEKVEKVNYNNEMALDGVTEALKRGW